MPRPVTVSARALSLRLQGQGLMSARQLADALGVDRSTISRGLAGLGSAVLRVGAARSSRYALRRLVRNLGQRWPLYRLDETGRVHGWGELHAVHGGFYWASGETTPTWLRHGYANGFFPGLPFFLSDLRPQGFLGRAIAREWGPRHGLPADLALWQDDDYLAAMVMGGADLPGNLIIGERALTAAQAPRTNRPGHPLVERAAHYAGQADLILRGGAVGSSAGGEQPKFTASVIGNDGTRREVLVKFSPPMDTPTGRRWADLLVAEYQAALVLNEHGHEAAAVGLLDGDGRRYLEVTRFDRIGAQGRRGVLSLQAIEAGLLDAPASDWPETARVMREAGLLTAPEAERLMQRWCFGRLIANTDMHWGNAAVWWGDGEPLHLAPVYDMLPMLFAPGPQGEIVPRSFVAPPAPPALQEVHARVRPWACEFWQRIAADERVSADFRAIAADALRQIGNAPEPPRFALRQVSDVHK